MKLITHNMLTSNIIKGVTKGYPLKIIASQVKTNEVDFNANFVSKILKKVEWPVLVDAAKSLGHGDGLPAELPGDHEADDSLLKKVHHALLEVEVQEGELECPETGRRFPIRNGIPNMLLNEDEVDRSGSVKASDSRESNQQAS